MICSLFGMFELFPEKSTDKVIVYKNIVTSLKSLHLPFLMHSGQCDLKLTIKMRLLLKITTHGSEESLLFLFQGNGKFKVKLIFFVRF